MAQCGQVMALVDLMGLSVPGCSQTDISPAGLLELLAALFRAGERPEPVTRESLLHCLSTTQYPGESLGLDLEHPETRLRVADHLVTEIMAVRMSRSRQARINPRVAAFPAAGQSLGTRQVTSASLAAALTAAEAAPALPAPLLTIPMDAQTWDRVESFASKMSHEFQTRRNVLLTRLNATVNSFLWSYKGQAAEARIQKLLLHPALARWHFDTQSPAEIMAARQDLAQITRVSARPPASRTGGLTKVKIGRVPDRGGRTLDQLAAVMPSWQKRQEPSRGHGGGRGPRGGYYQGGRGGGAQHHGGRGQHHGGRGDGQPEGGRGGYRGGRGRGGRGRGRVQNSGW